jgi:hypothetical protein
MAFYVGNNGSINVGVEATYGTAPTSGYDTLFGISSSLGLKRTLIEPAHLSINPVASNDYVPLFVDGEITCNWSEEADVMDELLKSFFTGGTSLPYTMTGGPANASITAVTAHSSSLGYVHTGLVATSFGLEIGTNEYPVVTMGFIGEGSAKDTTPIHSTPSISSIAPPTVYSSVSIGGTSIGVKSASVNCERQYSGGDRAILGGTTLSQPVEIGKRSITASLTVDLSDETAFNSVTEFDKYLSGTSLGTIIIGGGNSTITLSNCRMTGDVPSLGDGLTEFPISVVSTGISMAALA